MVTSWQYILYDKDQVKHMWLVQNPIFCSTYQVPHSFRINILLHKTFFKISFIHVMMYKVIGWYFWEDFRKKNIGSDKPIFIFITIVFNFKFFDSTMERGSIVHTNFRDTLWLKELVNVTLFSPWKCCSFQSIQISMSYFTIL